MARARFKFRPGLQLVIIKFKVGLGLFSGFGLWLDLGLRLSLC
jgi:hypothetical protein